MSFHRLSKEKKDAIVKKTSEEYGIYQPVIDNILYQENPDIIGKSAIEEKSRKKIEHRIDRWISEQSEIDKREGVFTDFLTLSPIIKK